MSRARRASSNSSASVGPRSASQWRVSVAAPGSAYGRSTVAITRESTGGGGVQPLSEFAVLDGGDDDRLERLTHVVAGALLGPVDVIEPAEPFGGHGVFHGGLSEQTSGRTERGGDGGQVVFGVGHVRPSFGQVSSMAPSASLSAVVAVNW